MSAAVYGLTDPWFELRAIQRAATARGKRLLGEEGFARWRAGGRGMIGPFAMADVFEPKEEALVRLALNEAASIGEQQNAAVALIQSLRKRGIDAEAVITGRELAAKTLANSNVCDSGAVRMPWGKYEGYRLDQIDEKYLRWVLWKCSKAAICATIRSYLKLPSK